MTITQGEGTDVEFVNTIATYKLELPPDRPAECPIKVTYSYDVNQRMHCKFEDVESGRVLDVDLGLDQDGRMTENEIEEKDRQLSAVGKSQVE